jgi:hypothetical protein
MLILRYRKRFQFAEVRRLNILEPSATSIDDAPNAVNAAQFKNCAAEESLILEVGSPVNATRPHCPGYLGQERQKEHKSFRRIGNKQVMRIALLLD